MYMYVIIGFYGFCIMLPAELGDYEEDIHTPGFISEFRFIPQQTEDMELAILEKFETSK